MFNVLHFGAGNIGRGFIIPILKLEPKIKDIKFLDINAEVITQLNTVKKYSVFEMGDEVNEIMITNISANLTSDILEPKLNDYINQTNLITISIGQNNLKYIVQYLTHLIKIRKSDQPLVIMCCENGNRVSSYLKNLLNLSNEFNNVFFVDTMVDRIIPLQITKDLDVQVETYYSWIIDECQWPKQMAKINSIKYSQNLDAEINKKLCLLNGVHAAIAWYRYGIDQFKIPTLQLAIQEPKTKQFVQHLMNELVIIIARQYNFVEADLIKYSQELITRFTNPHLIDDLERIGRNPITKLQINERILSPLFFAQQNNLGFNNLLTTFNNGLNYHYEKDPEGLKLKLFSANNSKQATIKEFIPGLTNKQIAILLTS